MSPVALVIFVITTGMSLYGLYRNNDLIYRWALKPYELVHNQKWMQIVSSGFVHSSLSHLIFNMLTFIFFAFNLESAIGGARFAVIYMFSLIFSDVTTVLKQKNNAQYTCLGASGAISGIVFSNILYYPYSKMMIFPLPFPIPAPLFAVLYLAYCYYAGKKGQDFINHEAHFWGALTGVVLTLIMDPTTATNFIEYLRMIF